MRILLIIFSVFFVVGCGGSEKESSKTENKKTEDKDKEVVVKSNDTYESLAEERVDLFRNIVDLLESVKDEASATMAIYRWKEINRIGEDLESRTEKLKAEGEASDEEMNRLMEMYNDEMMDLAFRMQTAITALLETEYGRRVVEAMPD
tara:strand:- start:75 stop:521 length:447 start_codon:yes stop_codon:yes gene_type:complete